MLIDYLRDKRMLLVLDNFEQVLEAASDIAELIAAAPGLKIVVTSRALLHIRGEQEFLVPPLTLADLASLPDRDVLMNCSAVALFVERAQMAKHDFQLTQENGRAVAEICAALDGLPLAIELAAARIKVLGPQELLARLSNRLNVLVSGARDLPERQQTIKQASWQQAAKYLGGATALLSKIGFQVSAQDREKEQRSLVILRGELGEECFLAAWITGQEMTVEEWIKDVSSD